MVVLAAGILWLVSRCMVLICVVECRALGLKAWTALTALLKSLTWQGLVVFTGKMLSRVLWAVQLLGLSIRGMR